MIPEEAVRAAHAAICEQNIDDCLDPDWRGKCVKSVEAAAPYILAGSARETVTEWAAAFPQTGHNYNYHRTREEAQAFVDGMDEVGAEMVVMTREVLPQDASEWRPAK